MPNLPTVSVTQAHFDRIVAAFPGANNTEKSDNYKAWLINHLIDEVERVESRRIEEAANTDKQNKLAELAASLPARPDRPERP